MKTEEKPRVMPNSEQSEGMVIGCMIKRNNGLETGCEALSEEDFYFDQYKVIFRALKSLYQRGKPADEHLVCEELERQGKLEEAGGPEFINNLAMVVGSSAYLEEYIEIVEDKALLRKAIESAKTIYDNGLANPKDVKRFVEESKELFEPIEHGKKKITPIHVQHLINDHLEMLNQNRGKKHLGLCVKTIDEINEKLLGLRGLILLAAAPNVGKTALTIQTGIEVLLTDEDTCLVYLSLEMSKQEILTRMMTYLNGMTYKNYVLGSKKVEKDGNTEISHTAEEVERIKNALNKLSALGGRVQIIDSSITQEISAKSVIKFIKETKNSCGCSRAIVIVDYLQVWPMPKDGHSLSDTEADKWRIGELKKIRSYLNEENQDPIIVISEARKPSKKDEVWGGELADVMGSARGTYTPDVVWLFSQHSIESIVKMWEKMQMPGIYSKEATKEEKGEAIKKFFSDRGIAIMCLKTEKCRDGMERFSIDLFFHYRMNKFTKPDWSMIMIDAMEHHNKAKK
jgi:replicative DNA helicase